MKRSAIYITALAGVLATVAILKSHGTTKPTVKAKPAAARLVSAPGRVEPLSEEIKIASEISGKLETVPVEEGDHVRRGQILATLSAADYRARVASAEAELSLREAELRRVVNGSRGQERLEAEAGVREAEAVMANARSEVERKQSLYRSGDLSRSESERAEREYDVARARVEAARQHHSFVDADAREEDRARAAAQVELARARVAEARATLAKTVIRAPIAGLVLRKHLKAGENVTDTPDTPVITLGDASLWRVRVDVDETDVARVHMGQKAYVTAEAFGDKKFWGRVVRVSRDMGRKNVYTDEPAERTDKKILETLIELSDGRALPNGMRVDAFIVPEN